MLQPFDYLKKFIKQYGIIEWLCIKQAILRSYNPYLFLRNRLETTTYEQFQQGMKLWKNIYNKRLIK